MEAIYAAIRAGKYWNEAPYASPKQDRGAFDAYRAEDARLIALFRADVLNALSIPEGPAADALWNYAWDEGHSSGLEYVAGVAAKVANLLSAGAAGERARVRRELRAWADDFMRRGAYLDSFLAAMDSICPEE